MRLEDWQERLVGCSSLTVRLAALVLACALRNLDEGAEGPTVKVLALILAASEEDVEASFCELVARGLGTLDPGMAS